MADRPMPERQMPVHVEAAYKDAVDNIIFLKRQQWVATNYALLVYAAIFVISAEYFSRTDFARNSLGIIAIAVFVIHCYVIFVFQRAIDKFRSRLYWIYRTYFNREEQAGLDLPLGPQSSWAQLEVAAGLVLVSFVGFVLTAIYLWSVR
jgi:amino acid permease